MPRLLASLAALLLLLGAPPARAGERALDVPVGDGGHLAGTLFTPSTLPAAGILVLHTRGGLSGDEMRYGADLAGAGFVALVVGYLRQGWGMHDPRYVRDLALAVDVLGAQPEVGGRPVGVVGFSLGSKGLSVAARNHAVKAVVGYYGVYDLRTLPQAKCKGSRCPPMPVDVAADIEAPVLLLHGDRDDETPIDQAQTMRDALVKAGKVVELVVYPGATHRFDRGLSALQRCARSREGYTYCLDERARDDAWARTLAWFRRYLAGTP